jgi:hypothetical protein
MADPVIILTSALQAIQSGHEYLERRKGSALSPEEKVTIEDWQTNLGELLASLPSGAAATAHPHQTHLPAHFDAIRRQFQGFHESSDFNVVHGALADLYDNVTMLAGPNGPGGGRPRPHSPGGARP